MKARAAGSWIGTLGTVLAILVPKGVCPMCLAASGSVLSMLGLTFVADGAVMQWLLAGLLGVGLLALMLSARSKGRWLPFWLAVAGSIGVYAGWFFKMQLVLYLGMALLVVASLVNLKKRRVVEPLVQIRLRKEPEHGKA